MFIILSDCGLRLIYNNILHNINNTVKEVKKVNVSVIGALIFFSYSEILLKAKITRIKNYSRLKAKEILDSIIPLKNEGN